MCESNLSTISYCSYYNSSKIHKKGIVENKQRYFCRECRRTFREGKDKRIKHTENFKMEVIQWYLENVGIRSISRRMKISVSMVVKWIKKFGKIVKDKLYETADNIDENDFKKENITVLEIDEIVTYVKKFNKSRYRRSQRTKKLYLHLDCC